MKVRRIIILIYTIFTLLCDRSVYLHSIKIKLVNVFRFQNDSTKLEECSYYNQNYSMFAKNGYNWSLEHFDGGKTNIIPCQTYKYSKKESVVTEVGTSFFLNGLIYRLNCYVYTQFYSSGI